MNRALANGVRDHLNGTGHLFEVGKRPADVDGRRPFGIVTVPSSTFEDDDVVNIDRAGDHLIRIDYWGSTYDSAGLLAADGDARMKASAGLTVAGHVVTLVRREQQQGPTRDDSTYPEPSHFRVSTWWRLWTEDATV